jgi:hypothetical protein
MKIITIIFLILSCLPRPVFAATDDFTADADITVADIAVGANTATLFIFNGSTAETWSVAGGDLMVTNPGTFTIGSTDSTVGVIIVLQSGVMLTCAPNTVPGTSSTTLPASAGTYIIEASASADCANLCPALAGASTYNAYPTCGAAVCASGYSLSGSGSGATCITVTSGGGGGGSISPANTTADSANATESSESHYVAPDGTVVDSETTTVNEGGVPVSVTLETVIVLPDTVTAAQTLELSTSQTSEFSSLSVNLPTAVLDTLKTAADGGDVKVTIQSRSASADQRTYEARSGYFLVGYDIFEIAIKAGDKAVTEFETPITLSFDIRQTKYRGEKLLVHYFNEADGRWELAGNGGSIDGGKLTVVVNHLTIFAVLFAFLPVEAQAATMAVDERTLEMERIYAEANVVFKSGADLDIILNHVNAARDAAAQTAGMKKYTDNLVKGLKPVTTGEMYAINNFIVYSTKSTKRLGAGERAGTVNSYRQAFGRLPLKESEWKDCIAIANGRWPREKSTSAENAAQAKFLEVYLRAADMKKPNDNAAVTIIAYGLRPNNRNLNSERAAMVIFKGIYKYNPVSALDWDIVRAIAYSGAKR